MAPQKRKTPSDVVALELPGSSLTEEQEAYFAVCEDKLGFVPNVLTAYSFEPAKLDSFSGLYNDLMLAESGLSKLDREIIAVVVSSINHCFYCLASHGAAVRRAVKADAHQREVALDACGARFLERTDPGFPARLAAYPESPRWIYVRGAPWRD